MPERNAVEIKSVSKVFGFGEYAVAAVDHVSVAIRENEFFTLLGPSGCGKTTLLRLIAGFEFPSAERSFWLAKTSPPCRLTSGRSTRFSRTTRFSRI